MQTDVDALAGWVPCKLIIEGGLPLVQWLYVSDVSFTDPFYDETLGKCKSLAYNSSGYRSYSSLESMVEWANTLPEIIPSAFIFHISRCGSTLLSQLIGLDKQYITLSEVPLFDQILRLHYTLEGIDESYRKKLFKAALTFIGKNNSAEAQQVFIKTDCWHIFFYQLFREMYPSVPFVLLYRSPDEVLASHQKLRGIQAIPDLIQPQLFGFDRQEITHCNLDEYIVKVLEKTLIAFDKVKKSDANALLLDYKQGVLPMIKETGKYLDISWTEEHLLQMEERSKFHSKHPKQNFKEDVLQKNIPEQLQTVMVLYKELVQSSKV
ncbi:MAG: sulfotransferase family protein [Bacteroidetes bacterium]|nr:sulfotransferase family protein [Bacteroidota bacterium]